MVFRWDSASQIRHRHNSRSFHPLRRVTTSENSSSSVLIVVLGFSSKTSTRATRRTIFKRLPTSVGIAAIFRVGMSCKGRARN